MIITCFFGSIGPNFKFPGWLLPQNAEIWRNSSNPVRIFGPSVCTLFRSFNFVNFRRSRPLTRLNFYWLMLNWAFYFRFYKKNEMKCINRLMTVCKQAYRNLKLQTNKPLYLVKRKKFECREKNTITHLTCKFAPFWEHRGELAPSRQILESTLTMLYPNLCYNEASYRGTEL